MNRIIKGRFHIASRCMAIGSAVSSSGGQHFHDVDVDGDLAMDMGIDTNNGADTLPIFYTPPASFASGPSTPRSVFSRTPSTPQSSISSFSQTFDKTPCPANNAFAPLPDFSDKMEEPSIFGQYMDKDKSSVFQVGLANAANTRLPGGDLGGGLREIKPMQATQKAAVVPPKPAVQDKEPQALSSIAADTRLPGSGSHGDQNDIEPQQGTQKAAIAQRLGELPTAEANGSSSSVPNAVTEKQPSRALGAQENSAGTSPVGQTQVSFPDTTQTTTAMGAEEPQPTDKGNDVAIQGQFNLSTSTFRLETVPQHFAQVNNPFLNAATPPASNGPTTVQQLGSQEPVSEASTANGVASQEQAYEVGSDDDPNVDVNFDFGKHFKRLMMTMGHQYERRRALLAALKAKPHVTYDEEYAMNMMDEMFYEILPRLASELLFPTPKCKLADQEDEAKCFVDSMLEDELNEKSFDLVQEAYEPRFGVKFRLWREHLFDIFSDWYLKILSPALPDLVHNMTLDEIKDLSEILWDNIWKYMDDHPPRNKL
ncbi:hypothetical protein UCDDA912_g04164 [Diaporthe ampelina]|uniref:Uncharacterized protein n=1 Tax=Diaporthe ampelina TaxID=1214573 RepID=A0A0G2FPD7_9PEZI|nr:hypothetical protein UCDDA912_g04164 [Diaporthe ampelina]